MEKVTIGIVNYNGKSILPETLNSIINLSYPDFEIIVADNNSTDGSQEWLEENYPQIKCFFLEDNLGPAGARQKILEKAETNYVFFLDNDISPEADVLTRLMNVIKEVSNTAFCHPEICDKNDPFVYHYNGGYVHYVGAFISRNNDLGERPEYEVFDGFSGAAFLVEREKALAIGGFDKDYFFNWEDGDFILRLTLAGYLCLNVPKAIVHHRSKPRGTSKSFYMVRNRWFFILKLYSWRTLLLSSPALLVFELSQALFLLLKGSGKDYFQGTMAVFKYWPSIMEKRRAFQKLKIKRDREWLHAGKIYVPENLLSSQFLYTLKHLYTSLFSLYWQIIKPLC